MVGSLSLGLALALAGQCSGGRCGAPAYVGGCAGGRCGAPALVRPAAPMLGGCAGGSCSAPLVTPTPQVVYPAPTLGGTYLSTPPPDGRRYIWAGHGWELFSD